MGRPPGNQWKPLGLDTDPVPGDPQRINEEAAHLTSVARQITNQVAMLRKMASPDEQIGQTPDAIKSSASDLADQLDKVVGRYQKVGSALTSWVPELEQAQRMSIQALDQAEVPYQKLNQAVVLPAGSNLTAQQKQGIQDYHTSMTRAQDELDAARALLNRATTLRDSSGKSTAATINSAIDDGVKDSWWDSFKDWVGHYAWLIKDIATGLEIVGTILAIAALIFTGVGWLVLAGIIVTAVALAGRTLLAITGNGSWLDVAVDAFALITFGAGKFLTNVLKGAVAASRGAAETAVMSRLADTVARVGDAINAMKDVFGLSAESVDSIVSRFGATLAEHASEFLPKVSEETTFLERLANAGDKEIIASMRNLKALAEAFPNSGKVLESLQLGKTVLKGLQVNFIASNVVGLGSMAAGGIEFDGPGSDPNVVTNAAPTAVNWHIPKVGDVYQHDAQDPLTAGLSTSAADGVVHAASIVDPELIPAFSLTTGTW
jgi:hypothetical protein